MRDVISLILMLIGAFFMFVAAVGVMRMPDLFLRMSATAKSATLGVACLLLAAAVHFNDFGIATRAVATIIFLFFDGAGGRSPDRAGGLYQGRPVVGGDGG